MKDVTTMEMIGKKLGFIFYQICLSLTFFVFSRRSHYRLIVENIASGTNWQVRIVSSFLKKLITHT
jgi:hypothetical protein